MPLSHGKTQKSISKNIETEEKAGKPHDQSVAIALNTAREAGAHIPKMASGGVPHVTFMENETPEQVKKTVHMTDGGTVDGESPIMTAIRNYVMGHKGSATSDQDEAQTAQNVEGSSDTAKGYAEGGEVKKTPHFLEGLKEGALHKQLGVSEDKNIPEKKLEKATDSDSELLRKRAQFAENAKHWHHAAKGGIMNPEEAVGLPGVPPPDTQAPNTGALSPVVAAGLPGVPALPGMEPTTAEKLAIIRQALHNKTLKMDDGGVVDASELPQPAPTDTPSKLAAIIAAIKGGMSQAASPITGLMNTTQSATAPVAAAAAPAVAPAINSLIGTNIPNPQPPTPSAPPVAPSSGQPPVSVAPAPQTAPKLPNSAPASTPQTPNPLDQWGKLDPNSIAPGLNPNDRQALAAQLQTNQHSFGSLLSEAMAGIGDALAARGGAKQDSLGNILALQTQQRTEALNNFDQARAAAFQNQQAVLQANRDLVDKAAALDQYGRSPALAAALGAPANATNNDLKNIWLPLAGQKVQVANHEQDIRTQAAKAASDQYAEEEKNRPMLSVNKSPTQQAMEIANLTNDKLAQIHGQAKIVQNGNARYVSPEVASAAMKQDPTIQRIF